jgi:hypothetical protein
LCMRLENKRKYCFFLIILVINKTLKKKSFLLNVSERA